MYLSVYKSFRQALFTFKRLSNSSEYPMEISCSRAEENAPGGSRYAYNNCKYPKSLTHSYDKTNAIETRLVLPVLFIIKL